MDLAIPARIRPPAPVIPPQSWLPFAVRSGPGVWRFAPGGAPRTTVPPRVLGCAAERGVAGALTRAGHLDVGGPRWVRDGSESDEHPPVSPGGMGPVGERHRGLRRGSISFAGVARPAGGNDVLPGVVATSRSRNHVVEVLRPSSAILAPVPIPGEHRSAVERDPAVKRNSDVPAQSDDGGDRDQEVFRCPGFVSGVDELGLPVDQQYHRAARRHHREWLVRGVQHQCSSHGVATIPAAGRLFRRLLPACWGDAGE